MTFNPRVYTILHNMDEGEIKYLSKEKYNELKKELEVLKTERRREIAEQLEFAKSLGDLSENAEYHEARETQAKTEERIMIIESTLKVAKIVTGKHKNYIDVGSTVTLKNGGVETWSIVGSEESDLENHKISNESPLGSVLIGKKEGEKTELVTPRGKTVYTIIKVE